MNKKLHFKLLLLLLAAFAGGGNLWAEEVTLTAGTNGSACKVNNQDGIKVGTSSKGGDMTITVPANTTKLTLHAAAWKGVTGLSLNITGATVSPASISLTADNGISNNSPFTLSGNESDFVFEITLSSISTETAIKFTSSTAKRFVVWGASAVVSSGGDTTPTCAVPTFSPIAGTYTETQSVTVSTTTEDATIYYTTDGTDPTTSSSVYSGAISVSETTTIKAIAVADGYDNSAVATAAYTIATIEHAGTQADPYTVADARAAIDVNTGITGVYATGTVSKIVTAYSSSYGNITFDISTDGTEEADQLRAYRCIGTDAADVQVGDVVVVSGSLTKYGDIYEFGQDCELVSLTHPAATICADPVFSLAAGSYTSVQSVEITCATEGATIYYTTDGSDPTANSNVYTEAIAVSQSMTIKAIAMKEGLDNSAVVSAAYDINLTPVITASNVTIAYDATIGEIEYTVTNAVDGKTLGATTTAEWISNIVVASGKVTFSTTANEDETNRTATVTLSYEGAASVDVTVTQKHFEVDYATLPFEWDDATTPAGITNSGVGTYNSSPYLKFDTTGDYVVLKINEAPGKLTFDIKGNNFSGGTFKVQTSADGENYADLETYTTLGNTQSEEFNNLASNVRFIKWIYTEKSSGNVALGNIALAKPSTDPVITVDPETVDVDAAEHEGTLALTYANLEISDKTDFGVQFYDANGAELTNEPDWIEVTVAEQDPQVGEGYVVSYYMVENDGDARTAYCKVFATGDEDFVYSNLVTITQAAYVAPGTETEYALFTGDLVEGDYVIYYDGYAMNNNVESGRLSYEEVTPHNDVITSDNATIVWHIAPIGDYWTIYSTNAAAYAAGTGAKNKAQMLDDGTDDKALWTVTGDETYEFVNKANAAANVNSNLRSNGTYGFACYATSTGGALTLYRKVGTEENVTITAAGYATYCSTNALDFSDLTGVTAYKATLSGTTVSFDKVTKVPAGEGILLKGAARTFSIPVIESADAFEDNALVGVTQATTLDPGIFVLMNGTSGVGFYKTTKEFTVGANTAYLPATTSVRSFIGFDAETTGIGNVNVNDNENEKVFDLQGRSVAQPTKGLYIVNGKKVVLK